MGRGLETASQVVEVDLAPLPYGNHAGWGAEASRMGFLVAPAPRGPVASAGPRAQKHILEGLPSPTSNVSKHQMREEINECDVQRSENQQIAHKNNFESMTKNNRYFLAKAAAK